MRRYFELSDEPAHRASGRLKDFVTGNRDYILARREWDPIPLPVARFG